MSQVSIQQVQGNSYYTTGIFAVGVYRYADNKVILIDSGSDEQSASSIAKALQANNLVVTAIINTHCHPDHTGGNYYFQKWFDNVAVYATYDEKFFIEDPKWAPRCFCGNAAPYAGLRVKHIAPRNASKVTDVIPFDDGVLTIDGQTLRIVALPGHTPGSIGIITPDNVLYSGDAFFGEQTFVKHPVLFYTDIEQTLKSLKKLLTISVDVAVMYHGGITHDVTEIVQAHEQRIVEIQEAILHMVQEQPCSIDQLTQNVMNRYKIRPNIVSFTLTQTVVRAYVTYLESLAKVELIFDDTLLTVQSK